MSLLVRILSCMILLTYICNGGELKEKSWSFFDVKMGMQKNEVEKIIQAQTHCSDDNSNASLRGATVLLCSSRVLGLSQEEKSASPIPNFYGYSAFYTKNDNLVMLRIEFNMPHPDGIAFKKALIEKYAKNAPSNIKVEIIEQIMGPVRDHLKMIVTEKKLLDSLVAEQNSKENKAISGLR